MTRGVRPGAPRARGRHHAAETYERPLPWKTFQRRPWILPAVSGLTKSKSRPSTSTCARGRPLRRTRGSFNRSSLPLVRETPLTPLWQRWCSCCRRITATPKIESFAFAARVPLGSVQLVLASPRNTLCRAMKHALTPLETRFDCIQSGPELKRLSGVMQSSVWHSRSPPIFFPRGGRYVLRRS